MMARKTGLVISNVTPIAPIVIILIIAPIITTAIICTIVKRAGSFPFTHHRHHFHFHRARGNKTIFLLAAVVLIFILSWLPLNLLNVLLDLDLYSSVKRPFPNIAKLKIKHVETFRSLQRRAIPWAAIFASGSHSVSGEGKLTCKHLISLFNTLFYFLTPYFTF